MPFPLSILADADTSEAPKINWHFEAWQTEAHLTKGLAAGAVALLVGILILILLRRLLGRLKLVFPATLLTLVISLDIALHTAERSRMNDATDSLTLWLNRAFAAFFVIIGLRIFDRAVLVPLLSRGGRRPVSRLLHQILNTVIAVFAILAFGSYAFGWDIDKFLAGSAVVSIVLGLALQESLGNFFSGLVMQGSPPFKLGDWVVCGNFEGRVVDMNWRAVTLHTNDDNYITIPNANISKSEITNFNAPTVATARTVKVGLEYDLPPCDALRVLKAAALETPGVVATPAPFIYLTDFGDSAILYTVKFWIIAPPDHNKIEHAVRTNIWYRLKEHGFDVPFPMQVQVDDKPRVTPAVLHRRFRTIAHVPLLAPLSDEQKHALAQEARDFFLAPGQILFHQGDGGETLYIIADGHAEVLIDTAGELKQVATLGPGQFFGEMAALTGQPRTATIRAADHLKLLEISRENLQQIITADPAILEKISGLIAQRDAERAAAAQHQPAPAPTLIAEEKRSLLTKMFNFFRL